MKQHKRAVAQTAYDSVADILSSPEITSDMVGQRLYTKDGVTFMVSAAVETWAVETQGGARLEPVATFNRLPLSAFGWVPGMPDATAAWGKAMALFAALGGGDLVVGPGVVNIPGAASITVASKVRVWNDAETIYKSASGGKSGHHVLIGLRDYTEFHSGKVSQSNYMGKGSENGQAYNKIGFSTQGASTGNGILVSGVGFEKCVHSFVYAHNDHEGVIIEKCYTFGQQPGLRVNIDANGLVTDWNATQDANAVVAGTQLLALTNFYNSGVGTRDVTVRGNRVRNICDCFAAANQSASNHRFYDNIAIKDTEGYYGGYGSDFNGSNDCVAFGNVYVGYSLGARYHNGAVRNRSFGNTYRVAIGSEFSNAQKNSSFENTVILSEYGTGAKQTAMGRGAGGIANSGAGRNTCADRVQPGTSATSTVTATISSLSSGGEGAFRVKTSAAHGMKSHQIVDISGVSGAEINGVWHIRYVASDEFELVGSSYSTGYTSGGNITQGAVGFAFTRVQATADNHAILDGMYIEDCAVGLWATSDGQSSRLIAETVQFSNTPIQARGDFVLTNSQRNLTGLSGSGVFARNLRGRSTITSGSTSTTVTFPRAEADADYILFISNSGQDLGLHWTAKTATGFSVAHTAPTANRTLEWMIVR